MTIVSYCVLALIFSVGTWPGYCRTYLYLLHHCRHNNDDNDCRCWNVNDDDNDSDDSDSEFFDH